MKGDFSRQTFDRRKHYSGILMQQGRVQLDADWNEQQAIAQYHEVTENIDVIGAGGAPLEEAGFAISAHDDKLLIGGGRYYVDGLLCENEATIDYMQQPDLPNPPDPATLLINQGNQLGLVYLDSWQRHITVLDDPSIREQALGADGPDTTTRLKTVWQVKVMQVTPDLSSLIAALKSVESDLNNLVKQNATFSKSNKTIIGIAGDIVDFLKGKNTDQLDKVIDIFSQTINTLIRFLRSMKPVQSKQVIQSLRDDTEKQILLLVGSFLAFEANLCKQDFPEWRDLITEPERVLNARTQPSGSSSDPCQLPPTAGFQRLENQLYRVEILQGGDPAQDNVTFVWSRDNGSVVTSIVDPIPAGATEVTVASLGPDTELGFAKTQLVEITDDTLELSGKPGQLVSITDINPATLQITLDKALAVDYTLHPKMRRWDGTGYVTLDDWIVLEDGIQIQFAAGNYRTGDYWLIPARTASGQIEWPSDSDGTPLAQPPMGIKHHYSRLALVWHNNDRQPPNEDTGSPDGLKRELSRVPESLPAKLPTSPMGLSSKLFSQIDTSIVEKELTGLYGMLCSAKELQTRIFHVQDCRSMFPSLTARLPALHVIRTSWSNDYAMRREDFYNYGLFIFLDGKPDRNSLLNGITVIVTVQNDSMTLTLPGQIDVIDNVIHWRFHFEQEKKDNDFFRAFDVDPVRVTLKGHAICRTDERSLNMEHLNCQPGRRSYLDGQTLGLPGARSNLPIDAKILRMLGFPPPPSGPSFRMPIDLHFPSGAGVRASDFESWFYIYSNTEGT
ncbi:DUF6519 domain-containing protein [Paenibacillus montanisoli]|uniref:Uncharacterized protein n=1 Tax=Paenibacillus montanisoli TaxID=2081970 RepID=A0A328U8A6_9BACL|nr:DUF6519 domain-containing protein [Paenibacillus montanisoli]RAP78312.1 hypothetical protein DL346_07750 [Paenibacillus montanisoli]